MKQKLSERRNKNNTIVVEGFNTPLSTIDRPLRQRINEETADLNKLWTKWT